MTPNFAEHTFVRELLHQYFNIAFLMGKPQDLPAGREQMKIGIALAFVTYVLALAVPYGIFRAIFQALIDLACTAMIMHVALTVMGLRPRFEQAFGGLCGASAFINLAALPLYALRPAGLASQTASAGGLADFVLLVWGLSLLGHVVRHTFEINMVVSILVSFVYFILLSTLISMLMPLPPVTPAEISFIDGTGLIGLHARSGA